MLLILYVVLLLIETSVAIAGMLDQLLLLATGSGYQPEMLLLKSWRRPGMLC